NPRFCRGIFSEMARIARDHAAGRMSGTPTVMANQRIISHKAVQNQYCSKRSYGVKKYIPFFFLTTRPLLIYQRSVPQN
ncbi:MAG: hypothetical protein ACREHG_06495, partial [Candidatus Saccharimonadales bacterium]